MNEVKVRLESYIRYKGVSVREFERNAKLSVGFVRNIRQNISPTKQKAIRSAYPELNVGWLLTGDGEMLIDKMPDSVSNSGIKEEESIKQRFKEYAIYRNFRSIREMERMADLPNGFIANAKVISNSRRLQISKAFPDLNIEWIVTGSGNMIKVNENSTVCTDTNGERKSDVKYRLLDFISAKGLSKSSFERMAGIANGYINNMRSLGQSATDKIATAFPDLNMGWLLTGEGSMIRDSQAQQPEPTKEAPSDSGGAINNTNMQNTEHEAFLQQLVNRLMAVNEAQSDELKKVRVLLEQQAAKLREMESALGCLPARRDDSVSEGNIPIGSVG